MPQLVFTNKGAAETLRQQEQLNLAAQKMGDIFKADAEDARRLERASQSIYKSLQTPQEQVLKKLQTIKKAQREGLIPPKEAEQSITRLNKKMSELRDTTEDNSLGFMGLSTNIGEFATQAIAGLSGAVGFASILRNTISETNALLAEQAQITFRSGRSLGSLSQLAGGDPVKLEQLRAAARKTFEEGAFDDIAGARNLTFELESAGALSERAFFSRLQEVDDAALIARSAALVQSSLGKAETGSLQAITSKSIAGALAAPGVSPSQISRGASIAAETAKQLGISDEELIAAISRVSEVTGSGEQAGQRVNQLFLSLIRKGAADNSFGQAFSKTLLDVKKLGLSEEALVKYLGSSEAGQAFGALEDTQAFKGRLRVIASAEETDLAGRTIATAFGQDEVIAGRLRRAEAAKKQISLQDFGVMELGLQAERDRLYADRINEGYHPYAVTFAEKVEDLADWVTQFIPTGTDSPRERGQGEVDRFQEEQLNLLREQNKKQGEAVEQLKETNRKLNEGGMIVGAN